MEQLTNFTLCVDIFVNTKMDEGPCDKVHSEALKVAFERSGDIYQYDSVVERHFLSRINEADRVIKVSCCSHYSVASHYCMFV